MIKFIFLPRENLKILQILKKNCFAWKTKSQPRPNDLGWGWRNCREEWEENNLMYFAEQKSGDAGFCYFTDQLTSQDPLAR